MMERREVSGVFYTNGAQSNLLKVAMLNKCQSENAASLFKSIRGLGLTVSGGRSPLLLGVGRRFSFFSSSFFFFFSSLSLFFLCQSSFNPNQVTSLRETFSLHTIIGGYCEAVYTAEFVIK